MSVLSGGGGGVQFSCTVVGISKGKPNDELNGMSTGISAGGSIDNCSDAANGVSNAIGAGVS